MNWMTSFNRKKHQRRINSCVRRINENIKNDDLWQGRFVIRQVGSPQFVIYEDRSGADLYRVQFKITDKVTGAVAYSNYKSGNEWCFFDGSDIWHFANDTIIKWREEYNF